jgi:methylglutamate dehydrogenase subunit C
VADEGARLGGSLLHEHDDIDGGPALAWADRAIEELRSMPDVRLMPRTTVFGWYDGNVFGALERVNKHVASPRDGEPVERYWKMWRSARCWRRAPMSARWCSAATTGPAS